MRGRVVDCLGCPVLELGRNFPSSGPGCPWKGYSPEWPAEVAWFSFKLADGTEVLGKKVRFVRKFLGTNMCALVSIPRLSFIVIGS